MELPPTVAVAARATMTSPTALSICRCGIWPVLWRRPLIDVIERHIPIAVGVECAEPKRLHELAGEGARAGVLVRVGGESSRRLELLSTNLPVPWRPASVPVPLKAPL